MAARKKVTPKHTIETENTTELDSLQVNTSIYELGLAPLEASEGAQTSTDESGDGETANDTSNNSETEEDKDGASCTVVLKKGSTYRFRGQVFKKGKAEPVEPEIAERLVNSGYFERG